MNNRSAVKPTLGVLFATAVVCFGLCAYAKWQARGGREDADVLVSEIHNLRIGNSTAEDVSRIASHHGRYRVYLTEDKPACAAIDDVCYFDFLYQNSLLARLHLATIVRLGVRVQVHQNWVDAIMIDITCGIRPNFFGIYINEGLQPFTDRTLQISNVKGEITSIRLTPGAPERERVYAFNLECFDHIGKCLDKENFLPAIFQ